MKVGVIIRGAISDVLSLKINIGHLLKYFDAKDIVISTWDDQRKIDFEKDIKVLYHNAQEIEDDKYFPILNTNNFLYQIYTIYKGLQYLLQKDENYDAFIQVRTDQFFEDYGLVLNKMQGTDKICVPSVFTRKDFPYHPSDMFVASNAQKFIEYYHSSMLVTKKCFQNDDAIIEQLRQGQYCKYIFQDPECQLARMFKLNGTSIAPEVRFCLNYLISKGEDTLAKNHPQLMKKHFDVVDLREIGEFKITANQFNLEINEINIHDLRGYIENSPEYGCNKCDPRLICEPEAIKYFLLTCASNLATDISEMEELTDDFRTWAGVYCGQLTHPENFNKVFV